MSDPDIHVRPATAADISVLLEARRGMFADMGEAQAPGREEGEVRLATWLAEGLADGSAGGWIAEDDAGRWVGALSVSHEQTVPSRHNMSGRQSYLFGLWVRPENRRRGVARALVQAATAAARDGGEGAVTLMASDHGRPLYQGLGFVPAPAMRLFFEPEGSPQKGER
ncbi:MAG: GNAT family N-acetyltransferase [Coriobacteriia bacterium]|nr:GNAT family N-acetyltransferase [Coriobacteriia bacterium]